MDHSTTGAVNAAPEPLEMATRHTLKSGRVCTFKRVPSAILRGYFVLLFPHEPTAEEAEELFGVGLRCARQQAAALARSPDAFTLIHSGHATRRAMGWHLHVVVIRGRWEKAWLYFVLCGKNVLQLFRLRKDARPLGATGPLA